MFPNGNIKCNNINLKKMGLIWMYSLLVCLCSCQKDLIEYGRDDVKVRVERGDKWLHNFPLFLGINKKNPPQIAVWLEDTAGTYLSTVYVTHKIATRSWQSAGGNRRKEALPHWCHARGVRYEDGLYLPTKEKSLTDGISGATPRGDFDVKFVPVGTLKRFVVKVEVNHSTDFNDYYPKSAMEGDANYSGGKEGSGQPALVYAIDVDLSSGDKSFEAVLLGHSSPDGSSGEIYEDLSGITTARCIVKRVTIVVQ